MKHCICSVKLIDVNIVVIIKSWQEITSQFKYVYKYVFCHFSSFPNVMLAIAFQLAYQ